MNAISSNALTAAPRLAVQQAQAALSRAQIELTSGRLADVGLGLGASTARYLSLNQQNDALQRFTGSNATVATQLSATTGGLDAIRTAASSFLSSLTAAASAGTGSGTLTATAAANLSALTATLNTTVAGQAIFAGINSGTAPMTTYATGSAAKDAVDSAFSTAFGTTQDSSSAASITGAQMSSFLSNSFASLFSSPSYAGTWSSASDTNTTAEIAPGESVTTSVSANAAPFRQLAQAYTMVQEFGGANFSSDAGQAVVAAATTLAQNAVSGIISLEAGVGEAQTAVSDADTRMASQMTYLSSESGNLVSVDPSTLSTRISSIETQIQASYEITSELQKLSLVNFLT